jgi:DNA-binding MarR family transcriptional regulator
MGPVELILLGRTLAKLGERALPPPAPDEPTGGERRVVIVMADIYEHPHTTVSAVARRTGLPQSAVSAAVARLCAVGSVLAEPDPADRRRRLLRRNPEVGARRREVATARIDAVVAAALGQHTASDLDEVIAALELLGRRLNPESITRSRAREAP